MAKINWELIDPLLGVEPDTAIAEAHNISLSSVTTRRYRLGIPAHPSRAKKSINWAVIDPVLGLQPDPVIAKQFKIDVHSVQNRRRKLGIAAHALQRKGSPRNGAVYLDKDVLALILSKTEKENLDTFVNNLLRKALSTGAG